MQMGNPSEAKKTAGKEIEGRGGGRKRRRCTKKEWSVGEVKGVTRGATTEAVTNKCSNRSSCKIRSCKEFI